MQYAVHYRLKAGAVTDDHRLLYEVYTELVAERPSWVSCASFLLDEVGSMVLLLATDAVDRLTELPTLAAYLQRLNTRCEGEPRAGVVDRTSLDTTSVVELGSWEPERGTWSLPPCSPSAVSVSPESVI